MKLAKVFLLPGASLLWLVCLQDAAHAAASPEGSTDTVSSVVAPAAEVLPAVTSYQQLVGELEARPNALEVDLALGEAYVGLGRSLQASERHQEAVEAFDKALQLLRKDKGLYELEQLPVLQARLDSSQALAAWKDVDAGRHLAHLITLKNPAASLERRYQTLRELGLWKLRAADEELLPDSLDAAKEAAELYRHELEEPEVRASYQGRALFVANLYLDLAAIEFMQAKKKTRTAAQRLCPGRTAHDNANDL